MSSKNMRVVPYTAAVAAEWDSFIKDCPMAVFMHSRRFLSYHGDRFADCSLLFIDGESIVGVLPAAAVGQVAESHPGATFGGLIHNGEKLYGSNMQAAITMAAEYYQKAGFSSLIYKAPPACYRRRPCDDDIYALYDAGARWSECKLSTVINLADREELSASRKKGVKKAGRAGLTIACGPEYLPEIWKLIEENLWLRHQKKPVHSFAEISSLTTMFPDNIKCYAGFASDQIVCGGIFFLSSTIWHAQYVHSNDAGRKIYALDLFYDRIINEATTNGMHYFSFGVSNKPAHDGGGLDSGLYAFKKQFGGGGEVMPTLTLPLTRFASGD